MSSAASNTPASIIVVPLASAAASSTNSVRPPSKSHYNSNSRSANGAGSTAAASVSTSTSDGALGVNGSKTGGGTAGGSGAGTAKGVGDKVGGARVVVGGAVGVVVAGQVRRTTLNTIGVNVCQKGNPIISHIKGVVWEYSDIVVDYQVGATTGLLFLSLRYHLLHPEYIHGRIEKVGQAYSMRIMLVQCDVDHHSAAIKELTKICIINNYTMMVAWSSQEAGRYLEIYKSFERKAPDMIKERVEDGHLAHLTAALTSIRGVNKPDVITLATTFGSFKSIVSASPDALGECVGLGDKKVKRLREAFTAPFSLHGPKKKSKERVIEGNAIN